MSTILIENGREIGGLAEQPHGIVELWKNSSSSSAFENQDLSIISDKVIDTFIFEYIINSTNNIIVNPLFSCEVDKNGVQCSSLDWYNTSGSNFALEKIYRQCLAVSSDDGYTITIGNCMVQRMPSYGSGLVITTDNTRLIPYRILGLIHND